MKKYYLSKNEAKLLKYLMENSCQTVNKGEINGSSLGY